MNKEKLKILNEMTWRTNLDGESSITLESLGSELNKWLEFAELWKMEELKQFLKDFLK